MVAKESIFDNVIEEIGSDGRFQKIFNYIFNFALVVFTAMCYYNITLALVVPEHWCHVPGRNRTNFTVDEWKNLTLPKEEDTRGRTSASRCKMYNTTNDEHVIYTNYTELEEIDCQHSWDYDQRWYQQTAPSQHNWVCEDELYVTNALVFNRVGDVVGTLIFGQLGDIIGRKPVYYITLVNLLVSRLVSTFTSDTYYLFTLSMFVGSLTSTAVFQSPLVTAMEITNDDNRAFIAMLQCFGWTLGLCLMPLIYWWLAYWRGFMLVTTLPCLLFFIPYKYMIESPRWLASKGKIKNCIKELEQIARTNGKPIPSDTMRLLKENYHELNEKTYGVPNLFSNSRLARNTILLTFCWVVTEMAYYFLFLNVSEVGGNPHLNFFWQALSEYPGNLLGRYCCDRYGRRWTTMVFFFITSVVCIPLIVIIVYLEYEWLSAALAVIIKFTLTVGTFANMMQSMEIYPTCVRQSGLALGSFASNVMCMIVPYIAYMGTSYNARYPYIILISLCTVGGIAALFLPETLHRKLPETLAEAQEFGADQSLWSFAVEKEEKPTRD